MTSKFTASIIKFDIAYPYGDKHDVYCKLAEEAADVNDLLVAEVGVKDYGDKDNEDLAQKFNVKKEDFPVVFLVMPDQQSHR